MANSVGKGWFAVELANHVGPFTYVPQYVWDAIQFAHGAFKPEILSGIFRHRIDVVVRDGIALASQDAGEAVAIVQAFEAGAVTLATVLDYFRERLPEDPICKILRA
jgi:putative ATP-dependent endonuclease of OLD family